MSWNQEEERVSISKNREFSPVRRLQEEHEGAQVWAVASRSGEAGMPPNEEVYVQVAEGSTIHLDRGRIRKVLDVRSNDQSCERQEVFGDQILAALTQKMGHKPHGSLKDLQTA